MLQSLPWVVFFFIFMSALSRRDIICVGYLFFGAYFLNYRDYIVLRRSTNVWAWNYILIYMLLVLWVHLAWIIVAG